MMYAQEVARMAREGLDFYSGIQLSRRMAGKRFDDITSTFSMGKSGERDRDLDLKSFNIHIGKFEVRI